MSVEALTLALKQKGVTPTEKLLLIVLANYAGPTFACWPSQRLLAEQTGLTERSVRALLAALEVKGLLTRRERRRPGGYKTTDMVTLYLVGGLPEATSASGVDAPDEAEVFSDLTGSNFRSHRKLLPISPEAASGLTTFEPSVNHQLTRERNERRYANEQNASNGRQPPAVRRQSAALRVLARRGALVRQDQGGDVQGD
jgi:DNA-binding transcriptional ArsR family regulator